jgi:DNA-binding LacI/PurR family transcriptional regulator/putative methionine-R-sulfoxide reductase with GAF domain
MVRNGRLTIGYLTPNILGNVGQSRWHGVVDGAREQDVNLVCFPGWYWRDRRPASLANALYDLVSSENLDGLILGNILQEDLVDRDEFTGFSRLHFQMPMVSIRKTWLGIPFVPLDNYEGMREALIHLIGVHGYQRIAFLRGPEGHPYADERYRAYTDVLQANGLRLVPELVTPASGWDESSIRVLLDERVQSPAADFDAVVAANDLKALDALRTLHERGFRVPDDVAVVGFNDDVESRGATPPLTTVAMPFYEQGQQATLMLVALLQGQEVPEQVTLPARLMVRQSCGCMSPAVMQAAAGSVEACPGDLDKRRAKVLAEVAQAAEGSVLTLDRAARLLDSFLADVQGQVPASFLHELSDALHLAVAAGGEVAAWQALVSILRCHLRPCFDSVESLSRAEDLWQQARVMIAETTERTEISRSLQFQRQTETLRELGQTLISTFDVARLMDVLAQGLPHLGISGCYLSLYEDPQRPTEWSLLNLAYNENGRVELEAGGCRFLSPQLVPEGILPCERAQNLVIEPLYFQNTHLGFVLFAVGPREAGIYEALRAQISGALQGASLIKQVESRMRLIQIAADTARTVSSILDPKELIQQVVDLIRERFDFYYVGLFLVQEEGRLTAVPRKWAVLRAGTGEAGQRLVKQRHRLEVGGNSMVGQCVASGEARIALDVGEEAAYFSNPLLPETRSELALPLISRGETIGALTIQSSRKAAFVQEDIATFQTMASQLANAIENARLFRQAEEALDEVKAELRRHIQDEWSRYLDRRR